VPVPPTFPARPKARADLSVGAVYAVGGGDGYCYYGQICPNKQVGFFRVRSKEPAIEASRDAEIMSRFFVSLPSIGHATRSGHWLALGRMALSPALEPEPVLVQWPVGTTTVSVWRGGEALGDTDAWDPKIQDYEVIAVYDAAFHVPPRLVADFLQPPDAWKTGGSVRRHRQMKEDVARRFPDQPWHRLPDNWVPTTDAS
jgi:hypothetical protein